jgi:hypothetical protein
MFRRKSTVPAVPAVTEPAAKPATSNSSIPTSNSNTSLASSSDQVNPDFSHDNYDDIASQQSQSRNSMSEQATSAPMHGSELPPAPQRSPSRRQSVKPDGFSVPPIGIDAHDENPEFTALRFTVGEASTPAIVADKINRLTELVQEISIKSRDNNSILCQMLFALEERINKRIDQVREEMIALIDRKVGIVAADVQTLKSQPANNGPPSSRSSIHASYRPRESVKPTTNSLSNLFENVDETASVVSTTNNKSSLAIPTTTVTYETKKIIPVPGFVIKTRKLIGEKKEKVFINVFHHESIEVVPKDLPKHLITSDSKPFLVMGNITHALDSNGTNCSTFNVGVSSEYFKPNSELDFKITTPTSIQKVNPSFLSPSDIHVLIVILFTFYRIVDYP